MALALQSDVDAELGIPDHDHEAHQPVVQTPPKKQRKNAGQRKSGKKTKEPKQGFVQCSECGKSLPSTDFWEDQNRCKSCFNNSRSLLRIAKNQGCKVAVQKLKSEQPQAFQALNKAYGQHRLQQEKTGKKVKFAVTSFIVDWQKRQGFKGSATGEMMWEREFYEFAAGAKMGFLTSEESKAMWEQMKAEAARGERASDERGPRGFLRLYVHTKDVGERYADVSQGRRYEMQETLKKASEDQIAARRQLVFDDAAMEAEGPLEAFESIRNAAETGGSGFGSAIGLVAPDLHDMVQDAKEKMSRRGGRGKAKALASASAKDSKDKAKTAKAAKAASKDGSGKESDSESSEDKARGGGGGSGGSEASDDEEPAEPTSAGTAKDGGKSETVTRKDSGKWYDADTKNLRAEKDFNRGVQTLKENMDSQMESMAAVVVEFRAKPEDAKAFQDELAVVLRRQEWLQAVKDDDETKLQDLLAQALQDDDATGSVAGSGPRCQSRDQASLARAGPCAGFEKLTVLRVFSDLASNFRTCSSTADLKAANEAAVAPRKLFNTLLASCKAAVAELRSSKQRAVSAAETLRKKRAKEAETEAKKVGKKRRANSDGKGHVASHAVFQLDASDCVAMTMATAWDKEWLLETAEPFVITGADLENIDGDGGALEGFLKDFAKAFNESSLKVTEGRASQPIDAQLAKRLQEKLDKMVHPEITGKPVSAASLPGENPVLAKALGVQAFGLAAGHLSIAKSENNQFSCLRWAKQGTREVAMLNFSDVMSFLEKRQHGKDDAMKVSFGNILSWATSASLQDLKNLIQAHPHAVVRRTVGPKDLLYTPAAAITFHRVLNDCDSLGFRMPLLSSIDAMVLPRVLESFKMQPGVSIPAALAAACDFMKKSSDAFVMKHQVAKPDPVPVPPAPAEAHALQDSDDPTKAGDAAAAEVLEAAKAKAEAEVAKQPDSDQHSKEATLSPSKRIRLS
ncbi:unnamed protein product [Symbiodinium sp. KB8]|nr:unnamed protein product [Symbiodinium sp. KB8]